MLPRAQRLRHAREIGRVLRQGRSFKGRFLRLKLSRNGQESFRWAFVVSNKVTKRATRRNTLRRQLRAVVAQHREEFISKPGCDVMVFATPISVDKTYAEVREDFERILRQAHLIRG